MTEIANTTTHGQKYHHDPTNLQPETRRRYRCQATYYKHVALYPAKKRNHTIEAAAKYKIATNVRELRNGTLSANDFRTYSTYNLVRNQ